MPQTFVKYTPAVEQADQREMPQTFVKYTPAVEQADPDFDKHLQTVIEATKQYIQDSVRDLP